MTDRIAASLGRLFDDHRIVFWYDTARDMRGEFDAVELPGVTKVEIANNEFSLKYQMLRQEQQFDFRAKGQWKKRSTANAISTSCTRHHQAKPKAEILVHV